MNGRARPPVNFFDWAEHHRHERGEGACPPCIDLPSRFPVYLVGQRRVADRIRNVLSFDIRKAIDLGLGEFMPAVVGVATAPAGSRLVCLPGGELLLEVWSDIGPCYLCDAGTAHAFGSGLLGRPADDLGAIARREVEP